MPITITVNDHTISAVLYDTAAGRALWDMLPFTVMMRNAFEREMISFLPADALPSDDAQNPESGSESLGESSPESLGEGGPESSAESGPESLGESGSESSAESGPESGPESLENSSVENSSVETSGCKIGDIAYWPQKNSLVIMYKESEWSSIHVPLGHTDVDMSFLEGMTQAEIRFERAREKAAD